MSLGWLLSLGGHLYVELSGPLAGLSGLVFLMYPGPLKRKQIAFFILQIIWKQLGHFPSRPAKQTNPHSQQIAKMYLWGTPLSPQLTKFSIGDPKA